MNIDEQMYSSVLNGKGGDNNNMLKRILVALFVVAVVLPVTASKASASLIKNSYMTVSDPRNNASNVTHTFYWINQTANIGGMTFQYCISPSGTCTDTGADGTGASLSAITYNGGAESNWTYSWFDAAWTSQLKNTATTMGGGGQQYVVTIANMSNPTLASCTFTQPGNASTATCYVRINTYADSTLVTSRDDGVVSMTITQGVSVSARVDPTFTFQVVGVAGDGIITRNGTTMTSGITTTVTTIPFGNLTAGAEKFAGHDLTVVSNTDGGYNVTTKMATNLTGNAYPSYDIDPFTGNGATVSSAQTWLLPTGGTAGVNTGWLGIGTNDTGVPGRAANSFFSLRSDATTLVMTSTTATTGESNEIAFGVEVNSSQPADNYTGILIYNAIPVY